MNIVDKFYVQVQEQDGSWSTITDGAEYPQALSEMNSLWAEHECRLRFRIIRITTETTVVGYS